MNCTCSGFPQPDIDRDCPTHGEVNARARDRYAEAIDSVLADEFLTRAVTQVVVAVSDDEVAELRADLMAETIRAGRMRDQRDEAVAEMHRWKAIALQLQARDARQKRGERKP